VSANRASSNRTPHLRLAACLAGGLLWLAGCGDSNGPPFGLPASGAGGGTGGGGTGGGGTTAGSIGVSLTGSPMTMTQGQSGTSTVTVVRNAQFTGAVTLAMEGAPAGVTATFDPATLAAGATTSTLTMAAAATAAPGTYATTLRATGTGVAAVTAPVSVVVTAAPVPAFAFTLNPTAVSVVQGASATTTATITRSGGFTGPLALTVTGLPAGVTATVDPASATGGTATITIAAAATAAPGTATLTVQAAGTGVTSQTASVALTVTAAPTTGSTFAFCADNSPVWFAVQDGTGPWTTVAPAAANNFNVRLAANRGGIAYVTRSATAGTTLSVLYASAAELTGTGAASTVNVACTVGGKTVNGSVAGVGAAELATVAFGGSSATVSGAAGPSTFQLRNVVSGARDLIASRATQTVTGSDISFTVNRLIVRRGLDPADGSTLPALDFGAAESFAPATADVTINNLAGDRAITGVSLSTANGSSASFFFSTSASATAPYFGLPDANLASGDLHSLFVAATPAAGTDASRSATLYFRTVSARTVTLGAALGTPTFTSPAAAPYLQLRAQLPLQAEYNRLGGVFYGQGTGATARAASVVMTAGYAGSGTAFDLQIPNLSTATGFDNAWGLQPGVSTSWSVFETGGSFNIGLPGQLPADGSTALTATRTGTLASP
jgi:hypothetical protein